MDASEGVQEQRLGCAKSTKTLPPARLDTEDWDAVNRRDVAGEKEAEAYGANSKLLTLSDVWARVRLGDLELNKIEPVLKPLWQCLLNLRASADQHVLPCPQKFRVTNRKLNWYNMCERQAACIRAAHGMPAKRTSRQQAWRALSASLRTATGWDEESEADVASGSSVVLFCPPHLKEWQVGQVLSVWRFTAQKNKRGGAKLVSLPVKASTARYLRICQMHPVDGQEGSFRSGAASKTLICSADRVGLYLHVQSTVRGIDGVIQKLNAKSVEAVEKSRLWNEWPKTLSSGRQSQPKGKAKAAKAPVQILDDDNSDVEKEAQAATSSASKPEKDTWVFVVCSRINWVGVVHLN